MCSFVLLMAGQCSLETSTSIIPQSHWPTRLNLHEISRMRSGCGPLTGAIWASNCDDIDSTSNNGYCNGGWEQGTTVTCDSNGYTPDYIGYNGGAYGYCYEPSNGGEACDAGFESYTSVAYCCPPEWDRAANYASSVTWYERKGWCCRKGAFYLRNTIEGNSEFLEEISDEKKL